MTTLSETCRDFASAAHDDEVRVLMSRSFMNGALEVLVQLKKGRTHQQLMDEVVAYGRTVATAVERAP